MNKQDLKRINARILECTKFHIVGNRFQFHAAMANKWSDDITRCDLVVINDTNYNTIYNTLNALKYDCTIIICNFTESTLVTKILAYLDSKPNNFQYSRQMLIDGIREDSILIKYSVGKAFHDRTDPITVFLVLKTGGPVYDSRYVNATASNIRKHLTHSHEIVCITDNSTGIKEVDRVIKMQHNWPKWWGKVELFREGNTQNNHCLFLDLDTVCINNIDFICKPKDKFYGLRDFYTLDTFRTGVLKWETDDPSVTSIYNKFLDEDISKYMNKGDHEWIGSNASNKGFLRDTFPGEICSYKKHLAHIHRQFMNPSIVCFHGDPRPHTVKDSFIKNNWNFI